MIWTGSFSSCYWKIDVNKEYREKTVLTSRNGSRQLNGMLFDFKTVPETFLRVMDVILLMIEWHFALLHFYYIVLFSEL